MSPAAAGQLGAEPVVTIESGRLAGTSEHGVAAFRGIPYAAPPVGQRRWRAPQPVPRWDGVRRADRFGLACPQAPGFALPLDRMGEDCLSLNVWTVNPGSPERRPVLVWIHGGGFVRGASSMAVYDGRRLAEGGSVVVTLNYRLGVFGFHWDADIADEAAWHREPTANFGLLDQIAVLRWVQRNIAAFGGNPDNVTIVGESAGGVSVLALTTSPLTRGLYRRAIVQSGLGRTPFPPIRGHDPDRPSAEARARELRERLGLAPTSELTALRDLPWRDVWRASQSTGPRGTTPFVDGEVLPRSIPDAYAAGVQHRTPLVIGTTRLEGLLLRRLYGPSTQMILEHAPISLDMLRQHYGRGRPLNLDILADLIWGDFAFTEPARFIARQAARAGQTVHLYSFDYVSPGLRDVLPGSPHGFDVIYLFGTFDTALPPRWRQHVAPEDHAMSDRLRRRWLNYTSDGDPNVPGLPSWTAFTTETETTFVFADTSERSVARHLDWLLDRFETLHRFERPQR
jgi:para-nitrobenzyl esterase